MQAKSPHPACSIREGSWEDFRDTVKAVEPDLFSIIEKISPEKKYKLYEVTYLYGERITDLGTICLPDSNGRPVRLDDISLPEEYRQQLSYGPTPLILQLTNGSEVFVDTGERIVPLNVFTPGDLYGLFEAIVPLTDCPFTPCWSVTAGARSVFMGAKVSDTIGHKRLRAEYGVNPTPPKILADQWDIFRTIANRSNPDSPWACKILIFSKNWFEKRDDNLGWTLFHNYLLTKSWVQSKYMRSRSDLSIMWEAFASAVRDRNLKPNPYILSNIMHNVFLANGTTPGFQAVSASELLLPAQAIEYAYENVYSLKEYAPIILHPWRLGAMGSYNPIYYSFSHPTMIEGTPAIRHAPSIISEMRDICTLMQTLDRILEKHGGWAYQLMKETQFEYFHSEEDKFGEIANSKTLVEGDAYLINCMKNFNGKHFPYQGPFFRGCIRISKKSV